MLRIDRRFRTRMLWSALVPGLLGLVATAQAEQPRKFVVLLAAPPRDLPGWPGVALPNPAEGWRAYFDRSDPNTWSFAEYWAEISYGTVNVSGDVAGWAEVPWSVRPPGDTVTWTDLNGNGLYDKFVGEEFDESKQMYPIDYNGDLPGTGTPNYPPEEVAYPPGLADGWWTPGERFLDLNGNGRYDALLEGYLDGWTDPNCVPDGQIDGPEVCDIDEDGQWDFPEPFEDFLRVYVPGVPPPVGPWVRLDPSPQNPNNGSADQIGSRAWALAYIYRNYPVNQAGLGTLCDPNGQGGSGFLGRFGNF